MFPPPQIEKLGSRFVLRDDLLPGGTKRRVLGALIKPWMTTCVYAGPVQGYAQVALAYACRDHGKRAVLFVAKRATPHPLTVEAAEAGATVVQVSHGYLSNVQSKAKDFCSQTGAHFFPLGFDVPEFHAAMTDLATAIPHPSEAWVAAGTGSLARALCDAWPGSVIHAVRVGGAARVGRAVLHTAPEKFEHSAKCPPPFPSAATYDAKVWQFFDAHAAPGALLWNVGK